MRPEVLKLIVCFTIRIGAPMDMAAPNSIGILLDPRTIVPAAAKACKLDPAICDVSFFVANETQMADRQQCLLQVTASVETADPSQAEAFAGEVYGCVGRYMERWADSEEESLKKSASGMRDRAAELGDKVATLYKEEVAAAEQGGQSPAEVLDALEQLRKERLAIETSLEADHARRDALARQLDITRDDIAQKTTKDEVKGQLERIVALREKALKTVQELQATGRVPEADITAAEEKLAEAQLALARRVEEVAKSAGGDMLTDLRREMMSLEVSSMEKQIRLARIDERRKKLSAMVKEQGATFSDRRLERESLERARVVLFDQMAQLNNMMAALAANRLEVTLLSDLAAGPAKQPQQPGNWQGPPAAWRDGAPAQPMPEGQE